jgi:hypothetical protein
VGLRAREFARVISRVPHSTRDAATGSICPANAVDVFEALAPIGGASFFVLARRHTVLYMRAL